MRYFMLLISRMFKLKQQKKKRKNIMARKTLNKKTKVLNLLSKGAPVSWKAFNITKSNGRPIEIRRTHDLYQ